MECADVRDKLPAIDQETFPAEVLAHVEGCKDCSAELAEYRELEANLGFLADSPVQPPAWLLGTVTERVAETARRRAALTQTRELGRATTRQIGEHRVAAGSALGLAVLGAVLLGRSRRSHRVPAVSAAA